MIGLIKSIGTSYLSIDVNKGTYLIALDKLCRPKNEGRVGIRKANMMNQALLMKVG